MNNGHHFLLDFDKETADKLGIPMKVSLWPSTLKDSQRTQILQTAKEVYYAEIRGGKPYQITLLKSPKPGWIFHVDVRDYVELQGIDLMLAVAKKLAPGIG